MLHCLLVYKLGGVKITLLCCLVKSGVGKTYTTVGKMCLEEVENKSGEDMFLPLFADEFFYNSGEKRC